MKLIRIWRGGLIVRWAVQIARHEFIDILTFEGPAAEADARAALSEAAACSELSL